MSRLVPPFAIQYGEGRVIATPTGDSVTVKADTKDTNGSLTVLEFLIAPKEGPALHTHLRAVARDHHAIGAGAVFRAVRRAASRPG